MFTRQIYSYAVWFNLDLYLWSTFNMLLKHMFYGTKMKHYLSREGTKKSLFSYAENEDSDQPANQGGPIVAFNICPYISSIFCPY